MNHPTVDIKKAKFRVFIHILNLNILMVYSIQNYSRLQKEAPQASFNCLTVNIKNLFLYHMMLFCAGNIIIPYLSHTRTASESPNGNV